MSSKLYDLASGCLCRVACSAWSSLYCQLPHVRTSSLGRQLRKVDLGVHRLLEEVVQAVLGACVSARTCLPSILPSRRRVISESEDETYTAATPAPASRGRCLDVS